jgi:hypothetical protein
LLERGRWKKRPPPLLLVLLPLLLFLRLDEKRPFDDPEGRRLSDERLPGLLLD